MGEKICTIDNCIERSPRSSSRSYRSLYFVSSGCVILKDSISALQPVEACRTLRPFEMSLKEYASTLRALLGDHIPINRFISVLSL